MKSFSPTLTEHSRGLYTIVGRRVEFELAPAKIPGKKQATNIRPIDTKDSQTGTITRYDADRNFGFIKTSRDEVYFHKSKVTEEVACEQGMAVEFEIVETPEQSGRGEAINVRYQSGHDYAEFKIGTAAKPPHYLERWASFDPHHDHLSSLKELALSEDWTRGGPNERRLSILSNYIAMIFYELYVDGMVEEKEKYARFNTGLVDVIYLPVFALFEKNPRFDLAPRWNPPWKFRAFYLSSEKAEGKILADNFEPRPSPEKYFVHPEEVIFDPDQNVNMDNFSHVVMKRIKKGRFSINFLKSNLPIGFDGASFDEFRESSCG